MKKLFLFTLILLLVLLVIPTVFADVTIVSNDINYAKINNDLNMHFFVYNNTGFLLNNSCYYRLYDSSGTNVVVSDSISNFQNLFDYEVNVTGSDLGNVGTYFSVMMCNNSVNGFADYWVDRFEVTVDGLAPQINSSVVQSGDMTAGFSITLFLLLITGFLFVLPFVVKNFLQNPIVNVLVRNCCWALAAYFMVLNSAVMASLSATAGLGLESEMYFFLNLFGWAGYVIITVMIVNFIFNLWIVRKVKKERDRYE